MSVKAYYKAGCIVHEILETNPDSALPAGRTIKHDQFDSEIFLDADSTPPASDVACFVQALTAGAATIDLTALVGSNGASVDGTGLKVQVLRVRALAANVGPITIIPAVADGYEGFGSSFNLELEAGMEGLLFGNDATPDIASDAKDLTLSGTGTDKLELEIVLG